jgi:mRNA interferase RelE/StbE
LTPWRITWTSSAKGYYSRMSEQTRERIDEAFLELEKNPFASGNVKRLHGQLEGLYRCRIGKFRMVFKVLEELGEVRILAIASRGDIYK